MRHSRAEPRQLLPRLGRDRGAGAAPDLHRLAELLDSRCGISRRDHGAAAAVTLHPRGPLEILAAEGSCIASAVCGS